MVTQRLKRWESPRKRGRNSKGRGGSARRRQQKKQLQMLRKRLKQQNTGEITKRQQKRKEERMMLLLFVWRIANELQRPVASPELLPGCGRLRSLRLHR